MTNFAEEFPGTRIKLIESIISGAADLIQHGRVQLAITPHVPQGWLGDHLVRLEFACVASPDHPLHQLQRDITERDLRQHRQLVVTDAEGAGPATLALAESIRQQVELSIPGEAGASKAPA